MPNLVLIAGPNGAGKSTTAPGLLRDALRVGEFINADVIASGLSGFAPDRVAVAAGRIMLTRMRLLAAACADFALETTLSSRSLARHVVNMRAAGYAFHLIYLYLSSAELAVQRVAERVRRGGHDVSERDVRRRYRRSLSNFFNVYRPIADSWLMLDNSAIAGPTPIAWRNVGGPVHIIRGGPWSKLREQYENEPF